MLLCKIDGCLNPMFYTQNGLCRKHYMEEYKKSPKGKKVQKKYRESPRGKEANKKDQKKYRDSPKGKKTKEQWLKDNPEYLKQWWDNNLEYRKQWKENNPDYHKEYMKQWGKDPFHRLNNALREGIRTALKHKKAGRHWEDLVGYTLEELMRHLKNKFNDKMNFDNYGGYWVIDHIKPISLFHYDSFDSPAFQKCWALENLQPLERIENMKKYNHY